MHLDAFAALGRLEMDGSRAVTQGVVHQVGEGAVQGRAVRADRQAGRRADLDRPPERRRACLERRLRGLEQVGDGHLLALAQAALVDAREEQQVVGQAREAVGLLGDGLQRRLELRVRARA